MKKISVQIGNKLRDYRNKQNISLAEFAKSMNITKAYISSVENGKRNLSINALKRILDVLGVDMFEFFDKNLKNNFQYSTYQDDFIKKILKNHTKWYSVDSGFWGDRYISECQNMISDKRNKKEVEIIKHFIKNKKMQILDVPCGYGRISNLLARDGYDVTGIDMSSYFIETAKKDATTNKAEVKYLLGDLFDFKLKKRYDIVLNIFTSIGYYETEEKNEKFISRLCGLVKNGGILIIETINPLFILQNYKPYEKVIDKSGEVRIYERFFDIRTSTNIEKITNIKSDNKFHQKSFHCVRLYYPHELMKICKKNNMKVIDILNSHGSREDVINSSRMWLIFKK